MKIDLSKLPEGTKWIAIDSDGEVSAHRVEPEIIGDWRGMYYAETSPGSKLVGNVHY